MYYWSAMNSQWGCASRHKQTRGAYTCHTPRGNSVVDYVITSANYLSGESHFETSPHSDHCPLTFKLISIAGYIFSIQKIKPTGWQPTSGHTRKIEP